MNKIAISFAAFTLMGAGVFCTMPAKNKVPVNNKIITADKKGFAILELFTSQGCSSCPPADEELAKYVAMNDAHIIPLAFHVDYWNRLGWVDSFSSNKFSQRQRAYAATLNLSSVYTPQLIINGQAEMIGSESAKIKTAVNNALNENPTLQIAIASTTIATNQVSINYTTDGAVTNMLVHAALVQKKATTNIRAGENKGMKLDNYNVVRDLATATAEAQGKIVLQLPRGAVSTDYAIVLFTQEKTTGKINGVLQSAF